MILLYYHKDMFLGQGRSSWYPQIIYAFSIHDKKTKSKPKNSEVRCFFVNLFQYLFVVQIRWVQVYQEIKKVLYNSMIISIIFSSLVQEEGLKPCSPNSYQFAFLWVKQLHQSHLFLLLLEKVAIDSQPPDREKHLPTVRLRCLNYEKQRKLRQCHESRNSLLMFIAEAGDTAVIQWLVQPFG